MIHRILFYIVIIMVSSLKVPISKYRKPTTLWTDNRKFSNDDPIPKIAIEAALVKEVPAD